MKKMTLPIVLCAIALIAVGTSTISCEKKTVTKQTQEKIDKKKPYKTGDAAKLQPAYGSVTVLSKVCGPIECAPSGFFGFTHYNRIRITKDAATIAIYPANMRYTIYAKGSPASGNVYHLTKVDEFNCTQNAPLYADPALANSSVYYVLITDASVFPAPPASNMVDITGPHPMIPFTSGNGKDGLPCE